MNSNVQVNPPIITRRTNVVNRYFYIDQPHINEVETQVVNHYIKRNKYYTKPICCEKNVYCEENYVCPNGNFQTNDNNVF